MLSMTRTCTGPRAGSSLRPNCSRTATPSVARSDKGSPVVDSGGARPPIGPPASGLNFSSMSYSPVRPVLFTTVRSAYVPSVVAICSSVRPLAFHERGDTFSSQLPLRKRHAGTGFQVALERHGARIICELNDDVDLPRSPVGRVPAEARVVESEPRGNIRSHACVVPALLSGVSENVDESFREHHHVRWCNHSTASRSCDRRPFCSADATRGQFLLTRNRTLLAVFDPGICGPPSRLRRYGGHPSPLGLPPVAHATGAKRERRVEAPPGFEPGMEVLQTSALPLGDGAGWKRSI